MTDRYMQVPDGCWLWEGMINDDGYGRVKIKGVKYMAHRVMYQRLVGEIPEGLTLDHLCRQRSCVNPHHLEVVTRGENARRSPRICTDPLHRTMTYYRKGKAERQCRTCKNERRRERRRARNQRTVV